MKKFTVTTHYRYGYKGAHEAISSSIWHGTTLADSLEYGAAMLRAGRGPLSSVLYYCEDQMTIKEAAG